MQSPLFIYVHGFNSSPSSVKARLLGAYMKTHPELGDYCVPSLSHWPAEAILQLETIITEQPNREIVLVGSSLGGYYSMWLTECHANCRTVLVNPAVYPYRLLADWLGDNQNIYTAEHYTLSPEHLHQLESFALGSIKDPSRYLLLAQTGDTTLDHKEAVAFFADSPQFIQPGGSHGFDRFEDLIPAIVAFANNQLDLPEPVPLPASF